MLDYIRFSFPFPVMIDDICLYLALDLGKIKARSVRDIASVSDMRWTESISKNDM